MQILIAWHCKCDQDAYACGHAGDRQTQVKKR